MSKNDRWLFYGLITLVCWVPIPIGSNRAWAWSLLELFTYTLTITWFWQFAKSYDFIKLKPYRPILYILGITQVWVIIQLIPLPVGLLSILNESLASHYQSVNNTVATISLDPDKTLAQLLKGISYLCIAFLTLVLTNTSKRLRILIYCLLISGVFQALYGTLFVLSDTTALMFSDRRSSGLATGTFIYRNHYANFLMMTLSIGVGLLVASLTSKRKQNIKRKIADLVNTLFSPKALMRMGLIIMVIALVLSRSRMGNAAFFISLTFCSVFALVFMQNKTRGLIWLFGSMMVIDIFIVSTWFGLEEVRERLQNTSVEQETRDEVVTYGFDLINQYPITGTGAGSFSSSFPSVKGEGINYFYNFAHNEYLQFTIEYGLPITVLLGVLILWSLWHAQYALRNRRKSLLKGLGFATMMAIIGQLIHISVDFTLQPPANAVYFIIILCLAWIARYSKFSFRSSNTS